MMKQPIFKLNKPACLMQIQELNVTKRKMKVKDLGFHGSFQSCLGPLRLDNHPYQLNNFFFQMSSIFYQFLSTCDMFQQTFSPSINPQKNTSYYKSSLGGMVSIIIMTLGLIFSGNLMKKWFANELIMKISSQDEYYNETNYASIFQSQNISNILEIGTYTAIDPFQEESIIMLPLLINITSGDVANMMYNHHGDNKFQIIIKDSLIYNQFYLILVKCLGNEQFLHTNQQCASQEDSDSYFALKGKELDAQIFTQTINVYTKEIKDIKSYVSIYIQKSIINDKTIIISYGYYEIRSGQFFTQVTNNYMLKYQYSQDNYLCQPGFLEESVLYYLKEGKYIQNIVGSIYLTSDLNVKHVIAEYPSLSEMFANMGSVFQTMFLVKYIIFLYNKKQMNQIFLKFFQDLYFPQLRTIRKIKQGKKTMLFLQEKQLDSKSLSEFQSYIDKQINQKMNYANLIYEISRIQIILQSLTTKKKIKDCLYKRSSLILEQDEKTKQFLIKNNEKLKDFRIPELDPDIDFFLYNYSEQKKEAEKQQSLPEISNNRFSQLQSPLDQIVSEDEIQHDRKRIQSSESMRPHLSY